MRIYGNKFKWIWEICVVYGQMNDLNISLSLSLSLKFAEHSWR